MHSNTRRFIAIVAIGSGLMLPLNRAVAQTLDLSAQWAQWALSIPTRVNPQLDTTGENCMVGQSGSIWFLAGFFGGTVTTINRACSVPAGKFLFFPAANQVNFNSPGVCGLPNQTVAELRRQNADFVNGVTSKSLSVTVDGQPVPTPRISSRVFEVALPEDNIFDTACPPENVRAGIYSPAVVDGFYAILSPLRRGPHTVRIHAENPSQHFVQDVTYNLTVEAVTLQ